MAWEPPAVYLKSYEIVISKETQAVSDGGILKIIYIHVLFSQKWLIQCFLVYLQVISVKMTWEKQLLIKFNAMSIMLIKF